MKSWITSFARKSSISRQLRHREAVARCNSVRLELLEDRLAPAVVLWDGGPSGTGTAWQTAANWVGDILPGAGDDAQIDEAFSGVTISSTNSVTINRVTSFAALEINNGLFSVAAPSTAFNGFTLATGTLTGAGDLTIHGGLNWTSGVMSGAGKTVIPAGELGTVSGPAIKLLGRTLENAGTLLYSGTNLLFGPSPGAAGVLSNLSGAVFEVSGGGSIVPNSANSGHAITNAGTFQKTTNAATSVVAVPISNTGSFQVQTGTVAVNAPFALSGLVDTTGGALNLGGGGHAAGFFVISSGVVSLTGGTFTLQNGVTGLGSGVLFLAGGTLAVDTGSSASVVKLTQRRGSVTGGGTLTVTGALSWAGGPQIGAGKTVVAAGATGTMSSLNTKFLSRTLENRGTLTYSGSNLRFGISGTGAIDNLGTMNVNGSGNFGVFAGAGHSLTNSNTFNVTGSSSVESGIAVNNGSGAAFNVLGGSLAAADTFSNAGTVDVQSGATLLVAGGYVQSAGFTFLSGSTLAANVTLDGGILRGLGIIDGNLVNGAQISIGDIGETGSLSVTGNYTQTGSGSLILELAGTAPGTFDTLSVGGTASLDGTLNVGLIDGFSPAQGDSFQVMTFESVIGDFADKNGLEVGDGIFLDPVFDSTSLTLFTV